MKGKLCLLIIFIYIFAASSVLVSTAEGGPIVIDFYYENEFDRYFLTQNGCDVEWEDNAVHMISTQDIELGEKGDPFITLDATYLFECDDYPYMRIKIKNLSDAPVFEMHFATDLTGSITATTCTHVDISTKDSAFKEYVFNVPERNLASMSVNNLPNEETTWTGNILQLRLDCMWIAEPSGQVPLGSEVYIEYVAFFQTEEEANNFDIAAVRAARTPTPTPKPTPEKTPTPVKTATATANKTATTRPTQGSSNTDEGGSLIPVFIGVGAAVVAIVVVAIIVIMKKKKVK